MPNIGKWVERKHGEGGFYATHVLISHSHLNACVNTIKKTDTEECSFCAHKMEQSRNQREDRRATDAREHNKKYAWK